MIAKHRVAVVWFEKLVLQSSHLCGLPPPPTPTLQKATAVYLKNLNLNSLEPAFALMHFTLVAASGNPDFWCQGGN